MAADGEMLKIKIEEEMKDSFLDYAMSVIVSRALPNVRDGLKPVHRRVLYAMQQEGILSNRRFSKSAGVVGEVIKKYHPHGDTAIYDTMVRMVQEFNMRYPLIQGQGNFGSIDGDPAAAYRYTEVRLQRFAEEIMADIDKETVDFAPNFDGSTDEPSIMPSRVPNLLVNGAAGIAVGMATNIPPHNLREIIDALLLLLDDPDIRIETLMKIVRGPDFPTGGFIYGYQGIKDSQLTGRGLIRMRAKAIIETYGKDERQRIVVTELPYQVNKATLVEKIADLVKAKKIEGISDLRDESDREGIRVVVELKRDAIARVILNQLYKMTQMQSTFGVINLALVEGRPEVLNLKEMLHHFVLHRREVVTRRTQYELRQAKARAHILEGLLKALRNIDAIIALIKGSSSPDEARTGLMDNFELSEAQAQAILEMRLQRLTGLEQDKIRDEYRELLKTVERLESILRSDEVLRNVIREELEEVSERYADDRRTQIVAESSEFEIEDLIADEEMVVVVTHAGYVKATPLTLYRAQKRGGHGVTGIIAKEGDFVEHLFVASTHTYLMVFTDQGRCYWIKVHQLPQSSRAGRGKALVNLLQLDSDEKVTAILRLKDFDEGEYLVMCTEQGLVKKTELKAYSNPRSAGIIAISLNEGDRLISVHITDGESELLLGTRYGKSIRFKEQEVRATGRNSQGVIGIRMDEGDKVVGALPASEGVTVLTVTEKGYGKRTRISEYRSQGRGGKGLINVRTTPKNGLVVGVLPVEEVDEIMMITAEGKVIRIPIDSSSVRPMGRATQGVQMHRLSPGDRVVSVTQVAPSDEEGDESEDSELPGEWDERDTEETSDTEDTDDTGLEDEDQDEDGNEED